MCVRHSPHNQNLSSMASNLLFLAACFNFSRATNPTCRTLSLDKPILNFMKIIQK